MPDKIKCTVSNCNYWDNGDLCKASAIQVEPDNGGRSAATSAATACHTFKGK
ncbi:MAG TPA: DUF1540 domain-containing protein [Bacillota bacterium]|nr:DUF1540 domain-containing protein [Bacillota bacterium]